MRLSTLQIGINTFAVYTVGQPLGYVAHIIFYKNFDYSSKFCILVGHHDPSSGKPLDTFKLLYPGTQFIMGYA